MKFEINEVSRVEATGVGYQAARTALTCGGAALLWLAVCC